MSIKAATLAVLFSVVTLSPLAAQNTTLKPLRQLVYEVLFSTTLTSNTEAPAFSVPPRRRMGSNNSGAVAAYTPEITRQAAAHQSGKLRVDVVAITDDGGLVVDASVDGGDRKAPATRIAILRDGTLAYDPNAVVLEEERQLLPLMRRDAFDHDLSVGAYWKEPIDNKRVKGTTEYRVLRAEGQRSQLEITRTLAVTGTSPYDENSRIVTDYDAHFLAPQSATLQLRVRRQTASTQIVTSETEIRMRLLEDTFRKREASASSERPAVSRP
jgi:hypothetical protein